MNNELNLTQLVTEVFGKDYVELVENDRKANAQYILNCRLSCIKSIMGNMKSMGKPPESKTFDRLYDLDLYDLQQLEVEYNDMNYHYHNSKGL